ncbi:hypothetical protein HDV01_000296 [Terramyces sp. JEL0728]|nr:hypothetical protein HDV01_000296 [Terramyces sp. JEL0728]
MTGKLKSTSDNLASEIDNFLDDIFGKEDSIPGATVTVVHQGETIVHRAHGYSNAETKIPVTVDKTLFRIASVTKSFTAATLFTLWERKGLPIEDISSKDANHIIHELESQCPEYSIGFSIENNGFKEPITLFNLFTHTAGFEDCFQGVFTHPKDDLSKWKLDPRLLNRTALMQNNFPRRIYPPGVIYSYSNTCYILMGYIIELLAGKPYPDALNDVILTPLGMTNSTAAIHSPLDPAIFKSLPTEALVINQPHETIKKKHTVLPVWNHLDCLGMAAGSIVSTANDMSKYVSCLLNNGKVGDIQVIGTAALELMLEGQNQKEQETSQWVNAGLFKQFLPHYKGLEVVYHDGYLSKSN